MEFNQTAVNPTSVDKPCCESNIKCGKCWKAGVLIVGILLAGSIAYAGYQFFQKQTSVLPTPMPIVQVSPTPTPDSMANWKTYTNNNFNFEIKYPPQFKSNDSMSPDSPKIGSVNFNDGNICSKNNITFDIGYNNFVKNVTDFNIRYKDSINKNGIMLYVADLPKDDHCLVTKNNDIGEKKLVIGIKENKGVKWSFTGTMRTITEKEDFELLKQIFSTFKFLE